MIRDIPYTAKHWVAFQKTALGLKHWRPHYLLHDTGKMLLLVFFKKEHIQRWHRKICLHHVGNIWRVYDLHAMVIDWECARLTKPDKPLNAFDTLYKFYVRMEEKITPILDKLGINQSNLH